jgi:hypothetical protein
MHIRPIHGMNTVVTVGWTSHAALLGFDNGGSGKGKGLFLGTELSSSSVAIPMLISGPNIHPKERDTKHYDKLKYRRNKLDIQRDRLVCTNWKLPLVCALQYRVIKKSPCTWWLQFRKLQPMFKVSPCQSPGIYWHSEQCTLRPCSH